jgi:hypothetical protein
VERAGQNSPCPDGAAPSLFGQPRPQVARI